MVCYKKTKAFIVHEGGTKPVLRALCKLPGALLLPQPYRRDLNLIEVVDRHFM